MIEYKIRYLPTFENDLEDALDYIRIKLQNPIAAEHLLEETEKSILKRCDAPLAFQPYYSKKDRKNHYYRIRVKDYFIYYVVIENVVEARRFLHSRRNIEEII
jgi:Plasmid stabilization system protein